MTPQPSPTIQLRESIDALREVVSKLREELALHNAKQESFELLVAKHERALYGDETHKGYLQRFDITEERVEKILGSMARALWVVVTALLGGLGLWVWEILKAGAAK